RPLSRASSSSQTGGAVYVRTALTPCSAIAAKSLRTWSREPNCTPFSSGANVPYVTPRTQSRVSPTARNFPSTRGGGEEGQRARGIPFAASVWCCGPRSFAPPSQQYFAPYRLLRRDAESQEVTRLREVVSAQRPELPSGAPRANDPGSWSQMAARPA